MPSSSASRRMVRAPGPCSSRRERATATVWATRAGRTERWSGGASSPGNRVTFISEPVSSARGPVEEKDGVSRGDGRQGVVVGVGGDAVEEDAHLHLPLPEIGPEDRHLLVVGELGGRPLVAS